VKEQSGILSQLEYANRAVPRSRERGQSLRPSKCLTSYVYIRIIDCGGGEYVSRKPLQALTFASDGKEGGREGLPLSFQKSCASKSMSFRLTNRCKMAAASVHPSADGSAILFYPTS
jgi:hypothetical protein